MDSYMIKEKAYRIRKHILGMGSSGTGAHIGGSLSSTDILAVLFFHTLSMRPSEPKWIERDYFILSKGHACSALYSVLAEKGFFSTDELSTYCQPNTRLAGHPKKGLPGIEFPTGSLGHGLSLAVGTALALKKQKKSNKVYVLMGDGELQEGSVWEAAMSASQYQLDGLIAIVDRNHLQISDQTTQVMGLEPLQDRWTSFGWNVKEIDGHCIDTLMNTFAKTPFESCKPSLIIANTIKGKGVSFMESNKKSHYVKLSSKLFQKAVVELNKNWEM
ncbi:transketolase [Paenibacillus kyungheensis]